MSFKIKNSRLTLTKLNPWMQHVKQIRKQYPELTLKEQLKIAKRTYKK